MCGIAGFWRISGTGETARVLRAMADAIAHRGPDDVGVWADESAGLLIRHDLSVFDEATSQSTKRAKIARKVAAYPVKAGIQGLRENTGFRVKPGMTISRLMCAGSIVSLSACSVTRWAVR